MKRARVFSLRLRCHANYSDLSFPSISSEAEPLTQSVEFNRCNIYPFFLSQNMKRTEYQFVSTRGMVSNRGSIAAGSTHECYMIAVCQKNPDVHNCVRAGKLFHSLLFFW